ncbi:hypothetical protein AQUSIP_08440 [Aquicella siphonis]|uniref:Uncharacterized protein n=1 Tax=Aquicella siphonis TaxID=254247 RepID=A0A5E4PFD4_9COXI|nr:hypothetical protein [Aquicella siphonis]VVC75554.1 hypothetical protein AQUSIP_08440 [Aquicella siphonis]
MFSKRNQPALLTEMADKLKRLTTEKAYVIKTSSHEVTTGKTDGGYYLLDQNSQTVRQIYTDTASLIDAIKSALRIQSDNARIHYSSLVKPRLFDELPPAVQKLFTASKDFADPLATLTRAAGLQPDEHPSQERLIHALTENGIQISTADIVKLFILSQTIDAHCENHLTRENAPSYKM